MVSTGQRLTAEEFLKLPEQKPYLELIDGEVVQKPLPQEQHGWLASVLGELINVFARRRKLAAAFVELRGRFGRDVLLPDVAVYRWERLGRDAARKLTNTYQGPPDIAIEIVSPDQTVGEMVAKCRRYLANGVAVALVIDPDAEVIILCHLDGTTTTLRDDDRVDLDSVLPGFELTPRALFDTLRD
jgi:Uma2 family endonuclease